jgi:hypothetical protein
MQRSCDYCGCMYQAQRSSSKFCGSTCRSKSSLGVKPKAVVAPVVLDVSLVSTTEQRLRDADRFDTVLGQQAMVLANRIVIEVSGSSMAALSKELRAVMVEALDGVAAELNPLDELRVRRDRLRTTG